MAVKRPPALDRIDIKILAALQRDGRSTNEKLASTVALSPRACLERVRRLEAAGIIVGYQALIDLALLSKPVTVFAEITLERLGSQIWMSGADPAVFNDFVTRAQIITVAAGRVIQSGT